MHASLCICARHVHILRGDRLKCCVGRSSLGSIEPSLNLGEKRPGMILHGAELRLVGTVDEKGCSLKRVGSSSAQRLLRGCMACLASQCKTHGREM